MDRLEPPEVKFCPECGEQYIIQGCQDISRCRHSMCEGAPLVDSARMEEIEGEEVNEDE